MRRHNSITTLWVSFQFSSSIDRKFHELMASVSTSLSALIVADRGPLSISEISPNTPPRPTRHDDVERPAGVAFGDDDLAGGEGVLAHVPGQAVQLLVVETAQQRHV